MRWELNHQHTEKKHTVPGHCKTGENPDVCIHFFSVTDSERYLADSHSHDEIERDMSATDSALHYLSLLCSI